MQNPVFSCYTQLYQENLPKRIKREHYDTSQSSQKSSITQTSYKILSFFSFHNIQTLVNDNIILNNIYVSMCWI